MTTTSHGRVCVVVTLVLIGYIVSSLAVYYGSHPEASDDCVFEENPKLNMDLPSWLHFVGGGNLVALTLITMASIGSLFHPEAFWCPLILVSMCTAIYSVVMLGFGISIIAAYTPSECHDSTAYELALALIIIQGLSMLANNNSKDDQGSRS